MANTDPITASTGGSQAASKLIRSAGLAAIVAGLLFVIIQPIHPPETLTSVSTGAWAIVHYVSLAMLVLFGIGLAGIYARQTAESGLLGLVGSVLLSLGLIFTAAFQVVEAFVAPLLVSSEPQIVEGLLGLVSGSPSDVDLGALPALASASSLFFPLGLLVFGIATLRAGILPRWASAVFAFGLPAFGLVLSLLPPGLDVNVRLAAVPIGVGLAWLGYAVWSDRREPVSEPMVGRAMPQPDQTGAA